MLPAVAALYRSFIRREKRLASVRSAARGIDISNIIIPQDLHDIHYSRPRRARKEINYAEMEREDVDEVDEAESQPRQALTQSMLDVDDGDEYNPHEESQTASPVHVEEPADTVSTSSLLLESERRSLDEAIRKDMSENLAVNAATTPTAEPLTLTEYHHTEPSTVSDPLTDANQLINAETATDKMVETVQ